MGFGGAFFIIFFVGGFAYLSLGIVWNVKRKGTSGIESIPNIGFWRDLPSLVKDGCLFTWAKIRGTDSGAGKSDSYGALDGADAAAAGADIPYAGDKSPEGYGATL